MFDVSCICHLADLAVKSGMEVLPIDIGQLFLDIFYYFYHSSKRKQEFCDLWCSLHVSLKQFLSIVLLGGLVYCVVLVFLNLMV